ncbi:tyrosine-protein phosphatase [Promicromonospora sp. NFX87]|uniref:tyrosine-protein phosphatase n=1 Tax=Promicromonospora sp. NFX87 TaxID=3402691 RepID=UPI003AFB3027
MTVTRTTPVVVPLSAPVNLRDLGGIPVAGGTVREGFAIRADDLSIVTPEVADALVVAGLRTVIDLRSSDEATITGRGPLGARTGVNYHHVPFMADIGQASDVPLDQPAFEQATFERMYVRMYEGAAGQIVTALAIIAHAPGTVAFHCAAGQDRTGVLAAAILLVLGAEGEAIVADYTRTGENSAAIMERIAPVMTPLMKKFGYDLDAAARSAMRSEFSPEPMHGLLTVLAERHGDPLAPLRAAGLTDDLVARLRERALTTTGAA